MVTKDFEHLYGRHGQTNMKQNRKETQLRIDNFRFISFPSRPSAASGSIFKTRIFSHIEGPLRPYCGCNASRHL